MNFPEKLLFLRNKLGMNQSEMGDKLGLSLNYISSLERERKLPSDAVLNHVDLLLDAVESGYYDFNSTTVMEEDTLYGETSKNKIVCSKNRTRMIPVIGWAHAGDPIDYEEEFCDEQDYVPTLCRDAKAFGLKLEGDSMKPRFNEGAELVVTPSAEVYSGQYVVVKFARHGGVLFRRLERMHDTITLIPENERYSIKEYETTDFEWIYPVFGVFERLMK